jgi:alginate O-acetyltransferase complex protein AlgI
MKQYLVPGKVALEAFWSGAERFIVGFGKKVLLANQLSPVVDQIFALPPSHLSSATAWLGIICYTLQIYFDFSGYTDMAIGIGQMFGFKTPENFNYPYISKSITEFWRRWHITLSEWFRDYLYIPLGGNRAGQLRTWLNLLTVFTLCGIWHGANWTFLVWGLWNGLFLMFERTRVGKKLISINGLNHVYACLAFILGWVFFRSADLPQASRYFLALFGLNGLSQTQSFWLFIDAKVISLTIAGTLGCTPGVAKAVSRITARMEERMSASVLWNGASLTIRLAIFFLALAASAFDVHKSFVYFKF